MTPYHFPIDDSEITLKCLLMRTICESSGGREGQKEIALFETLVCLGIEG